ncbi:MAG: CHASE domain-containing protein [Pseudomonadota bacterium]|nr:CHASE domain-containing protein [Pseudomonadota bacterium]
MKITSTDESRYNFVAMICGMGVALLGLTVIYGWLIGSREIVQINDSFAPMQFNTALCFVFSGMGIMAWSIYKRTASRFLGLLTLLVAAATLCEYIFVTDFGIDMLFQNEAIMVKTSHAGRMAPNTSLCFILTGLVLMLTRAHLSARLGFSGAILLLSLLAFVGYQIDSESIYGWGNLTRMAVHTALGFLVVSLGLLIMLFRWRKVRMDLWSFLPISLSSIVMIIAFFAWYSASESVYARNKAYFEVTVSDVQDSLIDRYRLYENALRAGMGLFYASDVVERDEWISYVKALDVSNHLPGISGVGYIDYVLAQDMDRYTEWVRNDGLTDFKTYPDTFYPDKFIIRLIEPYVDNKEAVGLDIGFEANRRAAAERARDLGVPALTKRIELVQDKQKQPGFLLLIPVYQDDEVPATLAERRSKFRGWVYAPFVGANFMEGLTDFGGNQVDVIVYDGSKVAEEAIIFDGALPENKSQAFDFSKTTQVRVAGRKWTLQWNVTKNFNPPANYNVAILLLVSGIIFSSFVYIILTQLLRRKEIIDEEVKEQTQVIKQQGRQSELLVQQLARSNEDLERFAYIASHDLQEPLRMVRSFTGLLEEQYADKLDDTAKKYIGFAYSSAGRMQELINDLLEYSRIGTDAERYEDMHLDDILDDVLENLQERIADTKAEITSGDLPKVYGNPVRMTRLLQNLVGNAIKYQPEDAHPKIRVSSEEKEDLWLISVTDNGIGIDEKYGQKIFEPFERLHGKSEYSGTGMGLAICKRIVEDFGGTIWIKSGEGLGEDKRGAAFFFTIPK